jgi:hypothetical protein
MNLTNLIEKSLEFNRISGADKETDVASIKQQALFTLDEARELVEAVGTFDLTDTQEGEIVKEALDVIVCAVGVLQKMQNRGYAIESAANIVGANNLSKYPTEYQDATESLKTLAQQGVTAELSVNQEYNVYVIRDAATGKVRKPNSYKKVTSDLFKKGD